MFSSSFVFGSREENEEALLLAFGRKSASAAAESDETDQLYQGRNDGRKKRFMFNVLL